MKEQNPHCNPLQGSTGKYRENPVIKTGNLQWEQGSPVMKAGISLWELTYRVSLQVVQGLGLQCWKIQSVKSKFVPFVLYIMFIETI